MDVLEMVRCDLAEKTSYHIVEKLLSEIYDRMPSDNFESNDTGVESGTELRYAISIIKSHFGCRLLTESVLQRKSLSELRSMQETLQKECVHVNSRLVRQLKRRDKLLSSIQLNYNFTTAAIQAKSMKRSQDAQLRFALQPPQSKSETAFSQWREAMSAVARLAGGFPAEFRKKAWLGMADHYIVSQKIDFEHVLRVGFNDRANPDDNSIGEQIVKDLHRTGCAGFNFETDQLVLRRVLLAYARWNKKVCAKHITHHNEYYICDILSDVVERNEHNALKILIYLIDNVMPESYFTSELRGLAVDMAVFRDLLRIQQSALSKHLDKLQKKNKANDFGGAGNYEPPLVNMYIMQWLLTLFATYLPPNTVLRLWDCVLIDGSHLLIKAAIYIWSIIGKSVMNCSRVDEFYSTMSSIGSNMLHSDRVIDPDRLVQYLTAPFKHPSPTILELRERYALNISPFMSNDKSRRSKKQDEKKKKDELACFGGICVSDESGGLSIGQRRQIDWMDEKQSRVRLLEDIKHLQRDYAQRTRRMKESQPKLVMTSMIKEDGVMARLNDMEMINHLETNRDGLDEKNVTVLLAPQIILEYPGSGDIKVDEAKFLIPPIKPKVHRKTSNIDLAQQPPTNLACGSVSSSSSSIQQSPQTSLPHSSHKRNFNSSFLDDMDMENLAECLTASTANLSAASNYLTRFEFPPPPPVNSSCESSPRHSPAKHIESIDISTFTYPSSIDNKANNENGIATSCYVESASSLTNGGGVGGTAVIGSAHSSSSVSSTTTCADIYAPNPSFSLLLDPSSADSHSVTPNKRNVALSLSMYINQKTY